MSSVGTLYNDLLALNNGRRGEEVYPIHKSLYYENKKITNLYSYILSNYDIPENGRLLDCGCGVGYGSMLLAKAKEKLSVHGISLSDQEIALAQKSSNKNHLSDRCFFEVKSFDEVGFNSYDCIIAVESLKHSPDIQNTMTILIRSLKENGQLFIIEDVGRESINSIASRKQSRDWELQRIFTLDDYHGVEGLSDKKVENMTRYLKTPNRLAVWIRVMLGEIMVTLDSLRIVKNNGARIIRGGFYQELLYASGKLDYLILSARKK